MFVSFTPVARRAFILFAIIALQTHYANSSSANAAPLQGTELEKRHGLNSGRKNTGSGESGGHRRSSGGGTRRARSGGGATPIVRNTTPTGVNATALALDSRRVESMTIDEWRALQQRAGDAVIKSEQNNIGDSTPAKAISFFAQGEIAYLNRDYDAALNAFQASVALQPTFALGRYGIGIAYDAMKKNKEAADALRKALQLDPHMSIAHKRLGDLYTRQGKRKDAQGEYQLAQRSGFDSLELKLSRARELMSKEKWEQAADELQDVDARRPSAETSLALGDCYREMKRSAIAMKHYQHALQLDKRLAPAYAGQGELLMDQGDYKGARAAFAQALALDPTGAQIDRDDISKKVSRLMEKEQKESGKP